MRNLKLQEKIDQNEIRIKILENKLKSCCNTIENIKEELNDNTIKMKLHLLEECLKTLEERVVDFNELNTLYIKIQKLEHKVSDLERKKWMWFW